MSSIGAARGAAVPVSNARAEASRKNGARSRGFTSPEGEARSSQNALKHGLRAQKYMVLPEEDAAEFAGLEAAMIEELAPVGALQTVLARRVAVAAWRLARADRIEADLFAERGYGAAGPGLALIRDGNGTRSFETRWREPAPTFGGRCAPTNRYRGAAMAEFWRALKTLKALQAEQAVTTGPALAAHPPGGAAQGARHAAAARPSSATGRTRERRDAPAGLCHSRAIDRRLHPSRSTRVVDAERTRPAAGGRDARTSPRIEVERTPATRAISISGDLEPARLVWTRCRSAGTGSSRTAPGQQPTI